MNRDDYNNVDVGKYRGIDDTEQRHDTAEVAQEMLDAYAAWEPPTQFDAGNPMRALGLIRAAYFAGWQASEARWITKLQSEEARERVARALAPNNGNGLSHYEQRPVWQYYTTPADAALASVVELLGEK